VGLGEALDLPSVATTYVLAVTPENLYGERKFFLPSLLNCKANSCPIFTKRVRGRWPF